MDKAALAFHQATKAGDLVMVETKKARNPKHHRKMWALITKVHETLPDEITHVYPTPEKLMIGIKLALGYCETMILPDDTVVTIPKSIAFANMDQESFDKLYQQAMRLISQRLLPGIDNAELEAEIAAEIR